MVCIMHGLYDYRYLKDYSSKSSITKYLFVRFMKILFAGLKHFIRFIQINIYSQLLDLVLKESLEQIILLKL